MKGKELIFIPSSVILGLAIAGWQFSGAGTTPAAVGQPAAASARAQTHAPAEDKNVTVVTPRGLANRDETVVDVESMDALGLTSYKQFIDRDDDWDEEEDRLEAKEKA